MSFDYIMLAVSNLLLFWWGTGMHFKTKDLTEEARALRSSDRETRVMLMEENVRRLARNEELWEAIGALKKSVRELEQSLQK